MCMQSLAIGKSLESYSLRVSYDQTARVRLIPADPERIAVVICVPSSGHNNITFQDESGTTTGFILTSGGGPLYLDIFKHGSLVTKEMFVVHSTGAMTCDVWCSRLNRPASWWRKVLNTIFGD